MADHMSEKDKLIPDLDKNDERNNLVEIEEEFVDMEVNVDHLANKEEDELDKVADVSSNSRQAFTSGGPAGMSSRIPHLHKLEKKHSSGDLHSRLKTRKLLGVGETDDGDVHRSKLSQILGHSDQLYIRLPSGLRIWQIILALLFFTMALWAMVFPFHYYLVIFETQVGESSYLPIRMYAIALLSLSLVYWKTLQTSDKDVIRMVLLTTAVFFTLQTIVLILFYIFDGFTKTRMALLLFRAVLGLVTGGFYWELGSKRLGMRRTPSNKDLQEKEHSQ